MQEFSSKEWLGLILVALLSGGFSIAIALSVGFLSLSSKVPRRIFWISICVQIGLSFGIFIGVTLWFYSQLTPESLPKDYITGCAIAYFSSAMPELAFGFFILILKLLRKKMVSIMAKDDTEEEKLKAEQEIPTLKIKSITHQYLDAQTQAERNREILLNLGAKCDIDQAPYKKRQRHQTGTKENQAQK